MINARAACRCRTCRRNSVLRCNSAVRRHRPRWRQIRKVSSIIWSSRSGGTSSLPNCSNAPIFRSLYYTFRTEIRISACRNNNSSGRNLKQEIMQDLHDYRKDFAHIWCISNGCSTSSAADKGCNHPKVPGGWEEGCAWVVAVFWTRLSSAMHPGGKALQTPKIAGNIRPAGGRNAESIDCKRLFSSAEFISGHTLGVTTMGHFL
jgi:hypothetical protein